MHVIKEAYQASTYLWFLYHETTKNVSTPPIPHRLTHPRSTPALNLPVPIYTPVWRENCENGTKPDNLIQTQAHRPPHLHSMIQYTPLMYNPQYLVI